MNLTALQKIVALLALWTAPVSAAKAATWEWLTHDRPASEEELLFMIWRVAEGSDGSYLDWTAMESFIENYEKDMQDVPDVAD